jgi:hypothetical protein
MSRLSKKCGSLDLPITGIALPFTFTLGMKWTHKILITFGENCQQLNLDSGVGGDWF